MWHVVNFKTDEDTSSRSAQYERQIRWYGYAISQLTALPRVTCSFYDGAARAEATQLWRDVGIVGMQSFNSESIERTETTSYYRAPKGSARLRMASMDCFYGFVEFLLATARDKDEGTLFDEKPSDDCYFPLQLLNFVHQRSSPSAPSIFALAPSSQTEYETSLPAQRGALIAEGLARDHPSVDGQGCPDDVGSLLRANEHDGICNFFGSADALVRNL
jgi:hypothetical protein